MQLDTIPSAMKGAGLLAVEATVMAFGIPGRLALIEISLGISGVSCFAGVGIASAGVSARVAVEDAEEAVRALESTAPTFIGCGAAGCSASRVILPPPACTAPLLWVCTLTGISRKRSRRHVMTVSRSKCHARIGRGRRPTRQQARARDAPSRGATRWVRCGSVAWPCGLAGRLLYQGGECVGVDAVCWQLVVSNVLKRKAVPAEPPTTCADD